MITPQDIREKTFEKALFGGYDMETVDSFLEELTNDLTLLQKENAVLKGKMKVLVDKIEEYRRNEEAVHKAVLSAQKMGALIEKEARDKAQVILNDARAEAERITGRATRDLNDEQARLDEVRTTSAKFIDNMDMLCRRQLEFLQKMGQLDFVRQLHASRAGAASATEAAAKPAPARTERPAQAAQTAPAQAQAQAVPASAPEERVPETKTEPEEIHEKVMSIEETVAKAIDEPVVHVRPELSAPIVEDERPTKSFNIVTDPEDAVDKSASFSLDDILKNS